MEFTTISGVQCDVCGKIHNIDAKTYLAFHGNVTVGKNTGIIGNEDNTKISIMCLSPSCMKILIDLAHFSEQNNNKVETLPTPSVPDDSQDNSQDNIVSDFPESPKITSDQSKVASTMSFTPPDIISDDKQDEKLNAFDPSHFK
jgi:hypothetical protein